MRVAEVFDKFLNWCKKQRETRTCEYSQQFLGHLKEKVTIPVVAPGHLTWAYATSSRW